MNKIPQTRYKCDNCGYEFKPRNPRPGDSVYCPKCARFHSKRTGFLKPPEKAVFIPQGKQIRIIRSKPIKPIEKKKYIKKGIDEF
jgi:rubredoxin